MIQEGGTAAVVPSDKGAGRELVVRQLLAGLAPRQLAECLVDAVQGFKGPLTPKMLGKVNKKLEFCRLSNKSTMRDYFVQVNLVSVDASSAPRCTDVFGIDRILYTRTNVRDIWILM